MHSVVKTEACLRRSGAGSGEVSSVDCERESLSELGVAEDRLVDAFLFTLLKSLYAGLELERRYEVGRSEVSLVTSLVLVSDGNVDTDTVDLALLELDPCCVPVFNDVVYDLIGLVETLVLFHVVTVPVVVSYKSELSTSLEALELVGTPRHGLFLAGVVSSGPEVGAFRGLNLACLVESLVYEGKAGHVVSCLVGKGSVFLKKRKCLCKNKNDLVLVVAYVDTNLREVHLRVGVGVYEVVGKVRRIFIPCSCGDKLAPELNGLVGYLNHAVLISKSLKSGECFCIKVLFSNLGNGTANPVKRSGHSKVNCCAVGLSVNAVLTLNEICHSVDAGNAVVKKVNGLTLLNVFLSVNDDGRTYIEGVCSVVLEEGVELFGHSVNEVLSLDSSAIFPLKVVTKSDLPCVALAAFRNAPLSVNLVGNVLKLGSCAVLDLELAGKDLAVRIILEIVCEEGRTDPAHNLSIIVILIRELVPVGRRKSKIGVVGIGLVVVVRGNVVALIVGSLFSASISTVGLLLRICAGNNGNQHEYYQKHSDYASKESCSFHNDFFPFKEWYIYSITMHNIKQDVFCFININNNIYLQLLNILRPKNSAKCKFVKLLHRFRALFCRIASFYPRKMQNALRSVSKLARSAYFRLCCRRYSQVAIPFSAFLRGF